MSVFPFYIQTVASGRSTPIKGGTRSKKGYMETFIYQRDRGEITTPFKIVRRSIEILDPTTPTSMYRNLLQKFTMKVSSLNHILLFIDKHSFHSQSCR